MNPCLSLPDGGGGRSRAISWNRETAAKDFTPSGNWDKVSKNGRE